MKNAKITATLRKILESMKRNEKSSTIVKAFFINEEDKELVEILGAEYNSEKDVIVEIELLKLFKVEDWFKDGTSLKRILRKGKGMSPQIDSIVKRKLEF